MLFTITHISSFLCIKKYNHVDYFVRFVSTCTSLISNSHNFYQNISKDINSIINCALISVKLEGLRVAVK